MRRSAALMLVAGSTLVLVMLVLLVRAVRSGPAAEGSRSAPATPTTPREAEAAPVVAQGSPPTAARSRNVTPVPGRTMPGPSNSDDGNRSAPTPIDDNPPPASRENTKNLHFGGTQLRAQTAAVEPLVKKCVEAAAASSPTGKAMLTYVVAKRGDKVAVEDTGIDEDKTTLQGEQLLDCLRETAREMKFEGLPREAEALVVTRTITLEHGAITEYKHVGFSYLR